MYIHAIYRTLPTITLMKQSSEYNLPVAILLPKTSNMSEYQKSESFYLRPLVTLCWQTMDQTLPVIGRSDLIIFCILFLVMLHNNLGCRLQLICIDALFLNRGVCIPILSYLFHLIHPTYFTYPIYPILFILLGMHLIGQLFLHFDQLFSFYQLPYPSNHNRTGRSASRRDR